MRNWHCMIRMESTLPLDVTDSITALVGFGRMKVGRYQNWPLTLPSDTLSIGERIRTLGVKTKKPMPSMLVEGVLTTPPTEDSGENVSTEG